MSARVRYGSVMPRGQTVAQRLWSRVQRTAGDGCWTWTGAVSAGRYGHLWVDGKHRRAHVVVWELEHGQPVPAGMVVDHLCGVTLCCRPSHLEAVPQGENVRRWWATRERTTCKRGHPYAGNRNASRGCRPCMALAQAARRATPAHGEP